MNNFQIQFGLNQNILPMTRDYIVSEEDRLRKIERKTPLLRKVSG